jgi:hypothetical protein
LFYDIACYAIAFVLLLLLLRRHFEDIAVCMRQPYRAAISPLPAAPAFVFSRTDANILNTPYSSANARRAFAACESMPRAQRYDIDDIADIAYLFRCYFITPPSRHFITRICRSFC